jgi:hypothetical protein
MLLAQPVALLAIRFIPPVNGWVFAEYLYEVCQLRPVGLRGGATSPAGSGTSTAPNARSTQSVWLRTWEALSRLKALRSILTSRWCRIRVAHSIGPINEVSTTRS